MVDKRIREHGVGGAFLVIQRHEQGEREPRLVVHGAPGRRLAPIEPRIRLERRRQRRLSDPFPEHQQRRVDEEQRPPDRLRNWFEPDSGQPRGDNLLSASPSVGV
jgi:hypothetical protein